MSLPVWFRVLSWGSLSGVSIWGSLSEGVFFVCFSVLGGPDRDPLYGEERALRILLECILFQAEVYFPGVECEGKFHVVLTYAFPLSRRAVT